MADLRVIRRVSIERKTVAAKAGPIIDCTSMVAITCDRLDRCCVSSCISFNLKLGYEQGVVHEDGDEQPHPITGEELCAYCQDRLIGMYYPKMLQSFEKEPEETDPAANKQDTEET